MTVSPAGRQFEVQEGDLTCTDLTRNIMTGAGCSLMLSGISGGQEREVNNDENDDCCRFHNCKHCSITFLRRIKVVTRKPSSTKRISTPCWFGLTASEPLEPKEMDGPTGDDAPPAPASWSDWALSFRSTTAPSPSSWSWNGLSSLESVAPSRKPPVRIPVRIPVRYARMKVLHLAIIKNVTRPAVDLCAESDLTSYSRFMRGR